MLFGGVLSLVGSHSTAAWVAVTRSDSNKDWGSAEKWLTHTQIDLQYCLRAAPLATSASFFPSLDNRAALKTHYIPWQAGSTSGQRGLYSVLPNAIKLECRHDMVLQHTLCAHLFPLHNLIICSIHNMEVYFSLQLLKNENGQSFLALLFP